MKSEKLRESRTRKRIGAVGETLRRIARLGRKPSTNFSSSYKPKQSSLSVMDAVFDSIAPACAVGSLDWSDMALVEREDKTGRMVNEDESFDSLLDEITIADDEMEYSESEFNNFLKVNTKSPKDFRCSILDTNRKSKVSTPANAVFSPENNKIDECET